MLTIRAGRRGFTLIEVAVVLVIAAIVLSITMLNFSAFAERTAARSAAMTFASDLRQARGYALRSRQPVTIHFDEDALLYRTETEAGDTISSALFGDDGEYRVDAIDLQVRGDSIRFAADGAIDFPSHGVRESTAAAIFTAGSYVYRIDFNRTGASLRTEG